jgi:surface antigen
VINFPIGFVEANVFTMPTNIHSNISTYLLQPDAPARIDHRNRLGQIVVQTLRTNPKIVSRTAVALLIWCGLWASIQYLSSPQDFSKNYLSSSSVSSITQSSQLKAGGVASLSRAVPAETLASSGSNQLLPPGTMASDLTFANSYARGQCTWYVAGRRQIPGGWGNANSWYYHAISSGWTVGTTPAVAAVAWTGAGRYGHVALVEAVSDDHQSVLVSEMNYKGPYIKDQRWAPASAFKYIY